MGIARGRCPPRRGGRALLLLPLLQGLLLITTRMLAMLLRARSVRRGRGCGRCRPREETAAPQLPLLLLLLLQADDLLLLAYK